MGIYIRVRPARSSRAPRSAFSPCWLPWSSWRRRDPVFFLSCFDSCYSVTHPFSGEPRHCRCREWQSAVFSFSLANPFLFCKHFFHPSRMPRNDDRKRRAEVPRHLCSAASAKPRRNTNVFGMLFKVPFAQNTADLLYGSSGSDSVGSVLRWREKKDLTRPSTCGLDVTAISTRIRIAI